MRSIIEQEQWYEKNWEQHSPLLGSKIMPVDPNPLYWIGFMLPENLYAEMKKLSDELQLGNGNNHQWLSVEEQHVTLALPGRPNKPYAETDLPGIIEKLREIGRKHGQLTMEMGNINCFPQALLTS